MLLFEKNLIVCYGKMCLNASRVKLHKEILLIIHDLLALSIDFQIGLTFIKQKFCLCLKNFRAFLLSGLS